MILTSSQQFAILDCKNMYTTYILSILPFSIVFPVLTITISALFLNEDAGHTDIMGFGFCTMVRLSVLTHVSDIYNLGHFGYLILYICQ